MIKVHIVPRNQKDLYMTLLPAELHSKDLMLIGAYDNASGEIAGVLAAHSYEGEMEIAYIFVAKSHLRQGIGSAMLDMLQTVAQALFAETITVSYVKKQELAAEAGSPEDYAGGLDDFFEKNGFKARETSEVYAVKIMRLRHGIPSAKPLTFPARLVPLREVTDTKWNLLRERIRKEAELLQETQEETETGIYLDPGDIRRYDRDVSCLYFNAKGEAAGCLLISKRLDGIYMDYFCILDRDVASKKAMMAMFDFAYNEAVNVHDVAVIFYVNTANRESNSIFSKIAGASKKLYGTAYERAVDF